MPPLTIDLVLTSRPAGPQIASRPTVSVPVEVTDISGSENKYSLDSHGFQLVHHESQEKAFVDDDQIKSNYYSEVEQLLKDT